MQEYLHLYHLFVAYQGIAMAVGRPKDIFYHILYSWNILLWISEIKKGEYYLALKLFSRIHYGRLVYISPTLK
jgi:hypothetical protein